MAKSIDYGESFQSIFEIDNINSLCCSNDGQKVLVKTSSNIYLSINGNDFNIIQSPSPNDIDLLSISPDGSTIVATIYNTFCYLSKDFGSSWQKIELLNNKHITSIAFSNDCSRIYISKDKGYITTSQDYGQTFYELTNSEYTNWQSIAASSSGQIIYAADGYGYIYKSSDFGSNWTYIKNLGKRNFKLIKCSDDGSKALITVNENINALIYTQDFFNNISYLKSPSGNPTNYFCFDYFGVSEDGSITFVLSKLSTIAKSLDFGKSWIDCSNGQFYKITHFSHNSDCSVLVLINDGQLFISYDKAESWQKVESININSFIDLAISDDGSTIVAISVNKAFISRNYGNSWVVIDFLGSKLYKCFVSRTGLCIGITSSNGLYLATDRSNDFKNPVNSNIGSKVLFSKNENIIVYFTGYIWYSYDGGKKWGHTANQEFYVNIGLSNDGTILLTNEFYFPEPMFSCATGYVYRYYKDFSKVQALYNYGIIDVFKYIFSEDNSLIFMYDMYSLYASKDKGLNWSRIQLPDSLDYYSHYGLLTKDKKKLILISKYYYISEIQ